MTNWYKLKRHILYFIFLWEGLYIFIYSHLLQYWSYLSMIWLKSLIFNLEYHKVFSKLYKGCLISLRHDDLIWTGNTALRIPFKLKLTFELTFALTLFTTDWIQIYSVIFIMLINISKSYSKMDQILQTDHFLAKSESTLNHRTWIKHHKSRWKNPSMSSRR